MFSVSQWGDRTGVDEERERERERKTLNGRHTCWHKAEGKLSGMEADHRVINSTSFEVRLMWVYFLYCYFLDWAIIDI